MNTILSEAISVFFQVGFADMFLEEEIRLMRCDIDRICVYNNVEVEHHLLVYYLDRYARIKRAERCRDKMRQDEIT